MGKTSLLRGDGAGVRYGSGGAGWAGLDELDEPVERALEVGGASAGELGVTVAVETAGPDVVVLWTADDWVDAVQPPSRLIAAAASTAPTMGIVAGEVRVSAVCLRMVDWSSPCGGGRSPPPPPKDDLGEQRLSQVRHWGRDRGIRSGDPCAGVMAWAPRRLA